MRQEENAIKFEDKGFYLTFRLGCEKYVGIQPSGWGETRETEVGNSRRLKVPRKSSEVIHIRKCVRVTGNVEEFQGVFGEQGVAGFG